MQYTKQDLKRQLEEAGLRDTDTLLIHSSMKAIGGVEGGADTVLDAWMECSCTVKKQATENKR